jgi:hypothetical protein
MHFNVTTLIFHAPVISAQVTNMDSKGMTTFFCFSCYQNMVKGNVVLFIFTETM